MNERKSKSSAEAAGFADDYLQARKQSKEPTTSVVEQQAKTKPQCNFCGRLGHIEKFCGLRPTENAVKTDSMLKTENAEKKDKTASLCKNRDQWRQGVKCLNCGDKEHIARESPRNSILCVDTKLRAHVHRPSRQRQGIARSGFMEGHPVDDILLDTGCSRTVVHRDLVPEERWLEGEAVTIYCAHGDTVFYLLDTVELV